MQAYSTFLDAAAADPRFNAGDPCRPSIGTMTELSWFDRTMHRLVVIPAVKRGLQRHQEQLAWMASRPRWGPGRIDPQNPFKFTTLEQPIDTTIGNSDMPPLWNMKARRGMALHWDGMNTLYREVLLSSGIGNGATRTSIGLDASAPWRGSSCPRPAIRLRSTRRWPERRARLRPALRACHAAGGARTGQVVPIGELGTDRIA